MRAADYFKKTTFGGALLGCCLWPCLSTSAAPEITRSVRVTTRTSGLFAKAMVARGQIDLSGNNVRTDSFDSADPNASTNGRYDGDKARDQGDVATNSGLVNSLSAGNANIWGRVATGPGGSVSLGPNGSIGSREWQTNGRRGIQPGYVTDDMNVSFSEVQLPFTGGYEVAPGNPLSLTFSGGYRLEGDLTGSLVVKSNVQATLVVRGNIRLTGVHDRIEIQPGASLRLYMAGESASIKGQGVINQGGNATNFYYFGLPSNRTLELAGNGGFVGAIYAPQADFVLGGGGNNAQDFVGASVTGTVKMSGHFNFHYDENLARVGPNRFFLVKSWNEIDPKTAIPNRLGN
jgi:hypothetical protein